MNIQTNPENWIIYFKESKPNRKFQTLNFETIQNRTIIPTRPKFPISSILVAVFRCSHDQDTSKFSFFLVVAAVREGSGVRQECDEPSAIILPSSPANIESAGAASAVRHGRRVMTASYVSRLCDQTPTRAQLPLEGQCQS